MLGNRLKKNYRHRAKWARRQGLSCFRVYDHDIPEWPLSIDFLDGYVALRLGRNAEVTEEILDEISEGLQLSPDKVTWSGSGHLSHRVQECGLDFQLELGRSFDYGLFLDHRNLRATVQSLASGRTLLNLFCYTASFTVYAATGGAISSKSVDLSKATLEWAQKNLDLNGLDENHQLVHADVMAYVAECQETFDIIVCDPPTFSNSKRAQTDFDVQTSHPTLLKDCLRLLNPGGTLYFSNNSRKFVLDERFDHAEEITKQTIPEDFRRRPTHRSWKIEKASF